MTRDEAVALIQEQLGFRSDKTASIIQYLKLAQITLEGAATLPWFITSEQHYIVTTVGERRLVLPTGFVRELDQARFVYIPDDAEVDPVNLVKDDYDVLAAQYTTLEGPPEAYALLGSYFQLFPLPDALYTIKMIFSIKQTTLDTNVENSWLKHAPLLMMGLAGRYVATALRDSTAKQTFLEWEVEGRKMLLIQDSARDQANRVPQIGGPH